MKNFTRLFMPVCLLLATDLSAQTSDSSDPSDDLLPYIESFFQRTARQHQEKLWLHLDKPYYAAGDQIWFRGYLVDAVTHQTDTLSNFIYVDLVNRKGDIVLSKKVKRTGYGFANNFDLPATFPAGDYTLRAYTGWMLNFDPDFFFQRNISIGNAVASPVDASISYTDSPDGKRRATVRFADPRPGTDLSIEVFDSNGTRQSKTQRQTSASGTVSIDLPPDSVSGTGYIDVQIGDGTQSGQKTFFLTAAPTDFNVAFFPEGGDLLPGQPQRIAFKGERPDGLPATITGTVFDRAGDSVAGIESMHDGMGVFTMTPAPDDEYTAQTNCNGVTRKFRLPQVRPDGYSLAVTQENGKIHYTINRAQDAEDVPLFLIGHVRGMCLYAEPVDSYSSSGAIETDFIPEGILHLLLLDGKGHPRSERLVFVTHPGQRERWSVTPDKVTPGKREKVSLEIRLADGDSMPVEGDFSISITDRKTVGYDPMAGDIRSGLLLGSDIKGHVENPGYYFSDDTPEISRDLDLVMMTNGWRRFDVGRITDTTEFRPTFFRERGQFVSGHVTGMMDQSASGAQVAIADQTGDATFATGTADDAGNFLIDGIDFEDTTTFVVIAKTAKGKPVQEVRIDENYPRPGFSLKNPFTEQSAPFKKKFEEYGENIKNNYDIENGMKVYRLQEVEVRAQNPNKPRSAPEGMIYDSTALVRFYSMPLYNFVVFLPHIVRVQNQLFMRTKKSIHTANFRSMYTPVSLHVNGAPYNLTDLATLSVEDVEYINLIHKLNVDSTIDGNCRLEITLKKNAGTGGSEIKVHRIVGYAKSVEFYNPTYDTGKQADKKADIRTTLYWNPFLHIGTDGKARIEFYSDDSEAPQYNITIEGISSDGKACAYEYP